MNMYYRLAIIFLIFSTGQLTTYTIFFTRVIYLQLSILSLQI